MKCCCDIIVVEQSDGSLLSTAFYVQWKPNKFSIPQIVNVVVNDQNSSFTMVLEPGKTRAKLSESLQFSPTLNKEHEGHQYMEKQIHKTETHELKQIVPELQVKPYRVQILELFISMQRIISKLDSERGYPLHMLTPNSNALAMLNLHPGENDIIFHIGKQKITGKIFKWHVTDRLVLCDIDGTVTRSDKRGILTSYFGIYSYVHTGIAKFLSSITQEYGYQMLYLTARPIEYTKPTRKFLQSVQQTEQHTIPPGPILTSFNSTFYAVLREYVLQKSDTFKIDALTRIEELFSENPFAMGLGNRPNDLKSYVAVGIPIDKIFIIDKKSQVKQLSAQQAYYYKSYGEIEVQLYKMLPTIPKELRKGKRAIASTFQAPKMNYGRIIGAGASIAAMAWLGTWLYKRKK
jgi:phosphatidate phosphatase PAH1